jgi:hypothetical protein
MLRIVAVSAVLLILLSVSAVLMYKGGAADLDVPGRTTDGGKNKLGEQ